MQVRGNMADPIRISMEKMSEEKQTLLTWIIHQYPESSHTGLVISCYYSLSIPVSAVLSLSWGDRDITLSVPNLAQGAPE